MELLSKFVYLSRSKILLFGIISHFATELYQFVILPVYEAALPQVGDCIDLGWIM